MSIFTVRPAGVKSRKRKKEKKKKKREETKQLAVSKEPGVERERGSWQKSNERARNSDMLVLLKINRVFRYEKRLGAGYVFVTPNRPASPEDQTALREFLEPCTIVIQQIPIKREKNNNNIKWNERLSNGEKYLGYRYRSSGKIPYFLRVEPFEVH